MARLNVILCDFCKKISKGNGPFATIKITKGRGEDKEEVSGEICEKCYTSTAEKIVKEVDLNVLTNKPSIELAIEESVQKIQPITRNPRLKNLPPEDCLHLNSVFEDRFIICKDCGDKTPT